MSIKDYLRKLIELQGVDAQVYQLRLLEGEQIPERLKNFDEELISIRRRLSEAEEKLKVLQLEKKNKELDLQTKESSVKKLQLQLFQVKTNKEYVTLEKEIEGLKADNSLLEEEIIHLLDEIDAVTQLVANERKNFEEDSKRIQRDKEETNQELEGVKLKLRQLEAERLVIAQQVDQKILPRYERVLKLRHGLAVVPIVDGSCQGCFMNLPPQVINLVYAGEDWIVCEQCARILYVDEDQKSERVG